LDDVTEKVELEFPVITNTNTVADETYTSDDELDTSRRIALMFVQYMVMLMTSTVRQESTC